MDQNERLDLLVEQFKEDSVQYRDLVTPDSAEEKRRLLRSLMNIRRPGMIAPSVLKLQDEYLKERAREKGIVRIGDIPTVASKGSRRPCGDLISVWQGDITRLAADAIVNAANSQMLGCFIPMHSCIDNCIHTFAGIGLRAECARRMNALRARYGPDYEQPTAVPMLTGAYDLPAGSVIHVVGPVVTGRLTKGLENDLSDCYKNTLELCLENDIRTIAFCCISTGVFRFPNRRAAGIAADTVTAWLGKHPGAVDRVVFNVFKDEDRQYYEEEFF